MNQSEARLGIVGPVFPIRGGVARHTTQLKRRLETRLPATTISFRMLYPRFLYPGKDRIEPGYETHREPATSYSLSSLNPVTWLGAERRLLKNGGGAVLIPWWTSFLGPCYAYLAHRLSQRGVRVVFLCHNTEDHESGPLRRAARKWVLSRCRVFVAHTEYAADRLTKLIPGARVHVYPHPVFEDFPAPAMTLPRRARHELLFFGLVRPYKGLAILVDAMRRLGPGEAFLTIAGEWWLKDDALATTIRKLSNIELLNRYIPEQEAADLFHRSDTVVLPYRVAAGTGVIPLACRYDRPVIASRVGGLADAVDEGHSGLLVPPGDPVALAAAIRELMTPGRLPTDGVRKMRARMTFEGLADCVLTAAGFKD